MIELDYKYRFFRPGRLYRFKNTFYVGKASGEKYFEFKENEILLYIEQWSNWEGIYHKFLKKDGQVANVEDHWVTQLIGHMERVSE
jgi:hypothetical protein